MKKNNIRVLMGVLSVALLPLSPIVSAQECDETNTIYPALNSVTKVGPEHCRFSYALEQGSKTLWSIRNVQIGVPCGVSISGDEVVSQGECSEGGPGRIKYLEGYPATVTTLMPHKEYEDDDEGYKKGHKHRTFDSFEIVADTCRVGPIGMGFKTRNKHRWGPKFDACLTEGPVPVPVPEPGAVSASTECLNLEEKSIDPGDGSPLTANQASISVERGGNGCVTKMNAYTELNCQGEGTSVPAQDPIDKLVYAGGMRKAGCPEITFAKTGSPFLGYEFISGGTPYRLCFDLADGSLVDGSLCGL